MTIQDVTYCTDPDCHDGTDDTTQRKLPADLDSILRNRAAIVLTLREDGKVFARSYDGDPTAETIDLNADAEWGVGATVAEASEFLTHAFLH